VWDSWQSPPTPASLSVKHRVVGAKDPGYTPKTVTAFHDRGCSVLIVRRIFLNYIEGTFNEVDEGLLHIKPRDR
jgi:hypothetical protein